MLGQEIDLYPRLSLKSEVYSISLVRAREYAICDRITQQRTDTSILAHDGCCSHYVTRGPAAVPRELV